MAAQMDTRVPKIRFKGFGGEWKRETLGKLCEPLSYGLNAAAVEFDGENKYIRITDIDDLSRCFLSNDLSSPKKDLSTYENYVLKRGDIVFARTGASVGKTYLYKDKDGRLIYAGFLIRARVINGVDEEFIFQNTLTAKYNQFITVTSQRSGQPGINAQEYSSYPFYSPVPEEQTKVGTYFRTLDELITLHQRKHDKLVTLKKSMLQKMFPQPGATVPEIRFKGFSGEWVEERLLDLCDLFADGDWIESKDQTFCGIRLLQTGNVGVNEFLEKGDKARWISADTFERLNCQEVLAGDILISRLPDPAGRACIVPKLSNKAITAVDCTIIRVSKCFDPSFLVQHFSLDSYFEKVKNYLGGGTRQRISRSVLGEFLIQVPTLEEQQKIGTYFRTLDELITKYATQLQKLRQIKSACLEKMFV